MTNTTNRRLYNYADNNPNFELNIPGVNVKVNIGSD